MDGDNEDKAIKNTETPVAIVNRNICLNEKISEDGEENQNLESCIPLQKQQVLPDSRLFRLLESRSYLRTPDKVVNKISCIRSSLPKEKRLHLHKLTNLSFTREKIQDENVSFTESKSVCADSLPKSIPPQVSAINQSLLLRLFESKLFDMTLAVSYLYKCKEPGVLQYIGNKLFSLSIMDAYFFLPQLVNMYTQSFDIAEVLHPFFSSHCRSDSIFALHCAWLLDTFSEDSAHHHKKSHGSKFRDLILSDELR